MPWRSRGLFVAPSALLLLLVCLAPDASEAIASGEAADPAQEGSCPAGLAGSAACLAAAEDASAAKRPRDGAVPGGEVGASIPRATIIAQELEELRGLSQLYRERISLLEELQATLADGVASGALPGRLPVRLLQEPLPQLSDLAGVEEIQAAAAVSDYLVSKAVVRQEEEIAAIAFLPLRNTRTASAAPSGQVAMPTTLLVASQLDGTLRLFTPSGELATTFVAGHDTPLAHVAVSPLHDEYVIATSDVGGIIRVHKVSVKQRRISKEDRQARKSSVVDKLSQHLGSQVNVTVQFNRRFRVPNGTEGVPINVTAIAMASQQGTKYFVVGDVDGNLTIFTRNGTLHARFSSGIPHPIESLSVHLGSVVFISRGSWGFVDLEKMEARRVVCTRFEGTVLTAMVDSQQQARVLVSDDAGDIWVFNTQNKRQCKIEHRFPRNTARAPVDLASIRGFALALTPRSSAAGGRSVLSALNMSHVGKKRDDLARAVPTVVWRRHGPPVRDWAVHKRYLQGDLVVLLSEDGLEIEFFEVLMQVYIQPQDDNFGNFKLPVFAVAIVLVLGYQYVKGKGAFDPELSEGMS